MQGTTLMDEQMNPIGNCFIWLDQRAVEEVAEIEARIDKKEMLETTASYCLTSYWAPKLLWLKKNRPEDFEKIKVVLFTKDYLRYMLTGEIATEVSDASLTFLMDVPKRQWSDAMFAHCGLPRSIVPERLVESQEVVGQLRKEIALELGLEPGIPVVAGGGDQTVGGVGTGVVRTGVVAATIGTSGVVFACTDTPFVDDKKRATFSLCHSVPEKYCLLGCTLGAGGSFKWARDIFFKDKQLELERTGGNIYQHMDSLVANTKPTAEGLTFLPYLNGEQTPYPDDNARGVLFGLSYRHGLGEISRAIMEGVTYSLRDTIEILREYNLDVTEVRASGGGAKSPIWLQMQADIYNANVVTTNIDEAPAAGAAILAGVGCGHYDNVIQASDEIIKVVKTIEPNAQSVRMYEEFYQTYRALYPILKDQFAKQNQLVNKWFYK